MTEHSVGDRAGRSMQPDGGGAAGVSAKPTGMSGRANATGMSGRANATGISGRANATGATGLGGTP